MYPAVYAAIAAATNVSATTKAANAVVTSTAHGLSVRDLAIITGAGGMTQINGLIATVQSVPDANTVTLGIGSTSFSAYTSGGTIAKVEQFTDDRNGNMVSNLGGSGTINYATGALSLTFNAAPANAATVTASWYVEESTDEGVLDFDTSNTGAGKPKIYRQDDSGGNLMTILPFQGVQYCLQRLRTWALTLALDDTTSTNLPYRNIGIPYPRAACETPDGILLLDVSNPNLPMVRKLQIQQSTNNLTVVPVSISDILDLTANAFDYAVAFRRGDYEIICVQEYTNAVANAYNSTMYVRNIYSKAWDKLDYRASALAIYNGALIGGDPLSDNAFTLFSGFDDDDEPIDNHWQDGQLNLGTDNLKRANLMRVTGLIQKDKTIGFDMDTPDITYRTRKLRNSASVSSSLAK
jgi:hypothetical protein